MASDRKNPSIPRTTVLPNPSLKLAGVETAHQPTSAINDIDRLATGSSDGPDMSVIGRPFVVSTAIETDCKKKGEDSICADVHQHLAKLAQEPRDQLWAAKMEELIQNDVESTQSNNFRILDIECRSTVCAAEVESTFSNTGIYGSYMGGMQPGHDALKASLQTNFNTFAYDTDPSGARVTVTVITFTRR